MTADYQKLMQSLRQKSYAPVYLIDGEEPYYIDKITSWFETSVLAPAERDFNLITLYGKETNWAEVVNACRRFPMFAERQVVILKEANQLADFGSLAGYLEHPSPTTILVIEHRFKKADARGKVVKLVKEKGVHFTSDKIRDEQVPGWIQAYGQSTGIKIGSREAELLATHLGGDLQKIVNEIEKVRINVPEGSELTAALIEKYIGISRDYNIFDFAEVLTDGNKDRLYPMLSYFTAHTKSVPMVLVIGALYNHFNKLYRAHFVQGKSDKDAAAALGTYPSRVRDLVAAAKRLSLPRIEYCLLLLGQYSAYAVGINSDRDDAALLKEMIGKMDLALHGR